MLTSASDRALTRPRPISAGDRPRVCDPLLSAAPVLRLLARRAGLQHGAGAGQAQPAGRLGHLPEHAQHDRLGATRAHRDAREGTVLGWYGLQWEPRESRDGGRGCRGAENLHADAVYETDCHVVNSSYKSTFAEA